jgi:hypothetical protein
MAVDHALVRTDPTRNLTISNTVKVFSFTGLQRCDILALTQIVRWQYGDKTAGMDATKYGLVLAGMVLNIPRDPSADVDDPWYVTIVRDSVDTFTVVSGYNQTS